MAETTFGSTRKDLLTYVRSFHKLGASFLERVRDLSHVIRSELQSADWSPDEDATDCKLLQSCIVRVVACIKPSGEHAAWLLERFEEVNRLRDQFRAARQWTEEQRQRFDALWARINDGLRLFALGLFAEPENSEVNEMAPSFSLTDALQFYEEAYPELLKAGMIDFETPDELIHEAWIKALDERFAQFDSALLSDIASSRSVPMQKVGITPISTFTKQTPQRYQSSQRQAEYMTQLLARAQTANGWGKRFREAKEWTMGKFKKSILGTILLRVSREIATTLDPTENPSGVFFGALTLVSGAGGVVPALTVAFLGRFKGLVGLALAATEGAAYVMGPDFIASEALIAARSAAAAEVGSKLSNVTAAAGAASAIELGKAALYGSLVLPALNVMSGTPFWNIEAHRTDKSFFPTSDRERVAVYTILTGFRLIKSFSIVLDLVSDWLFSCFIHRQKKRRRPGYDLGYLWRHSARYRFFADLSRSVVLLLFFNYSGLLQTAWSVIDENVRQLQSIWSPGEWDAVSKSAFYSVLVENHCWIVAVPYFLDIILESSFDRFCVTKKPTLAVMAPSEGHMIAASPSAILAQVQEAKQRQRILNRKLKSKLFTRAVALGIWLWLDDNWARSFAWLASWPDMRSISEQEATFRQFDRNITLYDTVTVGDVGVTMSLAPYGLLANFAPVARLLYQLLRDPKDGELRVEKIGSFDPDVVIKRFSAATRSKAAEELCKEPGQTAYDERILCEEAYWSLRRSGPKSESGLSDAKRHAAEIKQCKPYMDEKYFQTCVVGDPHTFERPKQYLARVYDPTVGQAILFQQVNFDFTCILVYLITTPFGRFLSDYVVRRVPGLEKMDDILGFGVRNRQFRQQIKTAMNEIITETKDPTLDTLRGIYRDWKEQVAKDDDEETQDATAFLGLTLQRRIEELAFEPGEERKEFLEHTETQMERLKQLRSITDAVPSRRPSKWLCGMLGSIVGRTDDSGSSQLIVEDVTGRHTGPTTTVVAENVNVGVATGIPAALGDTPTQRVLEREATRGREESKQERPGRQQVSQPLSATATSQFIGTDPMAQRYGAPPVSVTASGQQIRILRNRPTTIVGWPGP